ncbi:MAG: CvpA family protein [Oscillospiraceae bacterium]|nr:CvpA family protein [Oscillospiraceae bacterium]
MHYILDAAVIAIIIFFTWRAAKKGFVKTVVLFLGFLIAAFLARMVSVPLSENVYNSFVSEKVSAFLEEQTAEITGSVVEQTEKLTSSLPSIVKNAVDVFGGNNGTVENTVNSTGSSIAAAVETQIVAPALTLLIQTILFLVLFAVFLFVIKRVAKMMGFINKIPLVGKVNVFLGGILGTLEGVIIVFVAATVLYFIMLLAGEGFVISGEDVNNSIIFKFFHEKNPLIGII